MSGLLTALYRLTAMGLVCGAVLTLGGSGGLREILRLGCACAMTVVLLSALQSTRPDLPDFSRYEEVVQRQVENAQADQRDALLEQTERELAALLEMKAAELQLDCTVLVTCSVDPRDSVSVRQVEVRYHSGPREHLTALRETVCAQLAVSEEQILIQEAIS